MAYMVKGLKLHIYGAAITAEGCVCDEGGDKLQQRGQDQACTVDYAGDSIADAKAAAEAALRAKVGV